MADIKIDEVPRDFVMHPKYEDYVRKNGAAPKVIIVNPEFWQTLKQMYRHIYRIRDSGELKRITFNGIEVLRSVDLEFKDIRMY